MNLPMFEKIAVFVFGSIVGSFLNVVIHRLPLEQSIVFPGSHCPSCKKPIPWYDNIPLLSFLLLGARCRFCKKPINFRYFLVELVTASFFLVFYLMHGFSLEFALSVTLVSGLIASTFIDIQHRIIPDEISLGGIAVGFAFRLVQGFGAGPRGYSFGPALDSLLGILAGGGIIYLTGVLFDLVYFKLLKNPPIQGETESMGGGDVKLLAMIGAFLGWKCAVLTFFIAPFFGAVIGVVNLLIKKDHTIPYGPFLSLAAVICMLWSDRLIAFFFFRM